MFFSKIEVVANETAEIFEKKVCATKFFARFANSSSLPIGDEAQCFGIVKVDLLLIMTIISPNFIHYEIPN